MNIFIVIIRYIGFLGLITMLLFKISLYLKITGNSILDIIITIINQIIFLLFYIFGVPIAILFKKVLLLNRLGFIITNDEFPHLTSLGFIVVYGGLLLMSFILLYLLSKK